MTTQPIEFHVFSGLLPLIEGKEFDALVADIRAFGLREPIVTLDGTILDGRNRYRACLAAGVEPPFRDFDHNVDGDPLAFVISMNVRRRHLDESQRALIASRLANMRQGERTDLQPSANLRKVSQAEAAERLNVSERSVTFAALVLNEATPALLHAVEQGKIAVSLAAKLAAAPEAIQRRAVAEPERAHVLVKQERRAQREQELGTKQLAYPTKEYGLIVTDDEWDHEPWSRETGMDRHASNHYITASDAHTAEEMHERTKARFTPASNCLLAMWTTNQHLAIAIKLMELRGFRYVSNYCWAKDKFGCGHWNREKHELLLLGVRGHVPCPAPGQQWDSLIIMAPRGEHSAKPECFLEMLEQYFPTLPKIEINRRGPPRPGWDAWGNEVEEPVRE